MSRSPRSRKGAVEVHAVQALVTLVGTVQVHEAATRPGTEGRPGPA